MLWKWFKCRRKRQQGEGEGKRDGGRGGGVGKGLRAERIRTCEVEERHRELLGRWLECVILLELFQLKGRGREGREDGGGWRDGREYQRLFKWVGGRRGRWILCNMMHPTFKFFRGMRKRTCSSILDGCSTNSTQLAIPPGSLFILNTTGSLENFKCKLCPPKFRDVT